MAHRQGDERDERKIGTHQLARLEVRENLGPVLTATSTGEDEGLHDEAGECVKNRAHDCCGASS